MLDAHTPGSIDSLLEEGVEYDEIRRDLPDDPLDIFGDGDILARGVGV